MRSSRKAELLDIVTELNQRITQLEKKLGDLSRPVIEHVNIERVYLQNPVLEHLEFGLESIDIKELSGALNLGNNFGVNVERKKQSSPHQKGSSPTTKTEAEVDTEAATQESFKVGEERYTKEKTTSGYRFKVNSKPSDT